MLRDLYYPLFLLLDLCTLALCRSSFPSLTGILALGLFIHNAIITIMTNNKHQENNVILNFYHDFLIPCFPVEHLTSSLTSLTSPTSPLTFLSDLPL